ncbi:MAG: hypothetical protein ACO1SV_24485 [Fimbriimonas sp.]
MTALRIWESSLLLAMLSTLVALGLVESGRFPLLGGLLLLATFLSTMYCARKIAAIRRANAETK